MRSKLCLTVRGGKAKSGTHVVQETVRKDDPSQRWELKHQDQSLYIIASKVGPNLFLGIKDNSMNEEGKLVITRQEAYAFWRVIGKVPE